jgi:hypothetical protein
MRSFPANTARDILCKVQLRQTNNKRGTDEQSSVPRLFTVPEPQKLIHCRLAMSSWSEAKDPIIAGSAGIRSFASLQDDKEF